MNNRMIKMLSSLTLLGASFASFAGPFEVTVSTGTTLPATVIEGGHSFAYYRVTNITSKDLKDNYVKHLPDNVEQVHTEDPTYCREAFTLASGDHCILQLVATGPVVLSSDASKNIFVCSGPYDCSGVEDTDKLNIQVVSALASGTYCNADDCIERIISSGKVSSTDAGINPLLMQRSDDNWAALNLNSNHLPENYYDKGTLRGIACSNNFCMSGGSYQQYFTEGPSTFPLLALSPNGASNWNYQHDTNALYTGGELFATSCAAEVCFSVGTACNINDECALPSSTTKGDFFDPTLIYSLDGKSFGYIDIPELIDEDYNGLGYLVASGCSDHLCALGGSYESVSWGTNVPLLIEAGFYELDLVELTHPHSDICETGSHTACGSFYATSCSTHWCIAGGGTDDGGDEPFVIDNVLLAVQRLHSDKSQSAGEWYYVNHFMDHVNFSEQDGGLITSANCSGELCVVGGEYNDSGAPLLAQSFNGFEHWNYIKLGATPEHHDLIHPSNHPPKDYEEVGAILGVSCYENTCVAAGVYTIDCPECENEPLGPLLLQTKDAGKTWSYITNLPSDFDSESPYGQFYAVSCSAGICVAVGEYQNVAGMYLPLIAQSINGGTWTFVDTLPNDFEDLGALYGVNAPGGGNESGTDAKDLACDDESCGKVFSGKSIPRI